MEEKVERKNSKKTKYLLMLILVVIVVLAIIGGTYYYKTRPKVILKESYNYLTKGIKKETVKDENILQEKIKNNNQVKVESDIQLKLDKSLGLDMDNINLKIEASTDKETKIAHYKIGTKLDNEELFDIDTYLKDNKLYMTVKDIMDKYYFVDQEYFSTTRKDEEDIEILMNAVGNSVKKTVTDSKFSKTSEKIMIDKEEIKVTKLSINITDTLLSEVVTEFLKQARKDEKIQNALINVAGITKTELEETFTQIENEMKNTNNETILNYHIYYTGTDNIKMLELENDGDSLTYTANGDYHIQYKSHNEVVFDLTVTEEKQLEIKVGDITISGNYEEENKQTTLKVKDGNNEIAELTVKRTEKSDTENTLEIEVKSEGKSLATVTANNKYSFGEKFNTDVLKDAKSFEEITPEEIEEIQRKLEIHPLIGPLFQTFNALLGEDETTIEEEDFDFEDDTDFEEDTDSGFNYKVEYLH